MQLDHEHLKDDHMLLMARVTPHAEVVEPFSSLSCLSENLLKAPDKEPRFDSGVRESKNKFPRR